eukprot:3403194-Alexandrium_andersonii.AAC.1
MAHSFRISASTALAEASCLSIKPSRNSQYAPAGPIRNCCRARMGGGGALAAGAAGASTADGAGAVTAGGGFAATGTA